MDHYKIHGVPLSRTNSYSSRAPEHHVHDHLFFAILNFDFCTTKFQNSVHWEIFSESTFYSMEEQWHVKKGPNNTALVAKEGGFVLLFISAQQRSRFASSREDSQLHKWGMRRPIIIPYLGFCLASALPFWNDDTIFDLLLLFLRILQIRFFQVRQILFMKRVSDEFCTLMGDLLFYSF